MRLYENGYCRYSGRVENKDETVGDNIRKLREARGLSQAEVADALTRSGLTGIYPQTITKMEKGTRALKFVEGLALANILGVEAKDLSAHSETAAESARLRRAIATAQDALDRSLKSHREFMEAQLALAMAAGDASPSDGLREAVERWLTISPTDVAKRALAEWDAAANSERLAMASALGFTSIEDLNASEQRRAEEAGFDSYADMPHVNDGHANTYLNLLEETLDGVDSEEG